MQEYEGWKDEAACKGAPLNIFFPDKTQSYLVNTALAKYCVQCPVRKECSDYRKKTDTKHGVWGGKLQTRSDD